MSPLGVHDVTPLVLAVKVSFSLASLVESRLLSRAPLLNSGW